jgi:hypothetical protein
MKAAGLSHDHQHGQQEQRNGPALEDVVKGKERGDGQGVVSQPTLADPLEPLPVINWRHFTFISADQGDGKEECRRKKARGLRAD